MSTCTVPGCDAPYLAKGMCQRHYSRARRGTPLEPERPRLADSPYYGSLDDDGDTVRCNECGGRYRSLGAHVRMAHDMAPKEYRLKWGIPLTKGLVPSSRHEQLSQDANARIGTSGWKRLEDARDPLAASRSRDESSFRSKAVADAAAVQAERMSRENRKVKRLFCTRCGAELPERRVGRKPRIVCDGCLKEQRRAQLGAVKVAQDAKRATRNAEIVRLLDAGMSRSDVATQFGMTYSNVSYIAKNAGR